MTAEAVWTAAEPCLARGRARSPEMLRRAALSLLVMHATPGAALDPAALRRLLVDFSDWAMGLDVDSDDLRRSTCVGPQPLNASIFINGNLARALLVSSSLTGNQTLENEALRWCDALVKEQAPVLTSQHTAAGYWGVGYPVTGPRGDIYLGDTGSAVTALGMCHRAAAGQPQRRAAYYDAMSKYAEFVRHGCKEAGCGYPEQHGAAASKGWLACDQSGSSCSVGCGYYQGHLSVPPYVIATGTTGAAFFAEYAAATRREAAAGGGAAPAASAAAEAKVAATTAAAAAAWLASQVSASGEVPYILDGNQTLGQWPFDTAAYVTEGVLATDFLGAAELDGEVTVDAAAWAKTAAWLVRLQNADGSWGSLGSPDSFRAPRVASLLGWCRRRALTALTVIPGAEQWEGPPG